MQISFSGTHGTGKSTAAALEYRNQKMLHPDQSVYLLCDLESLCPFPINRETTEQAQSWMFASQIQHETQAASRFDVVITDRTIVDVIAYTYVSGFEALACAMLGYAEHHVRVYDDITVKQMQFNAHCHQDGIRETDPGFRAEVEVILKDLYQQLKDTGAIHGNLYFA